VIFGNSRCDGRHIRAPRVMAQFLDAVVSQSVIQQIRAGSLTVVRLVIACDLIQGAVPATTVQPIITTVAYQHIARRMRIP
jgi:hypothetical protein